MRDCGQHRSLSKCRRRARSSIFAAAATFLIFSPSQPVEASSPPYNAYQYDLTTPQFTPDGRLLQVEYASRAPEQSGPLVAVPVWPNNGDGEEDGCDGPSVVIASIAARSPSSSNDDRKDEDDSPNNDKNSSSLNRNKRRRKGQSRLISLPLGPTVSTPGAPSTPTPSIVVGLSGILADATSLLGILQDSLTQYRRMYGLGKLHAVLPTQIGEGNTGSPGEALPTSSAHAAPTVVARRVGREVGRKCQINSFGGGIRPFGASVVICGVDESGACICITQPSGAVLASHFPFTNPTRKRSAIAETDEERKVEGENEKEESTSDNVVVVGGDVTVQRRLREQLANKLSPDGSLRSTVEAVVTSLLEAQGYIENDSLIPPKSPGADDDIADLEIVIARSDGSYKLTTAEVGAIIDRIIDTGKGGDTGVA